MHSLSRICSGFTSPLHRWLTWRRSCTRLFVGGLSYDTNETALKDAFDEYGEIIEVKVICDRVSGKSRGYGFVHYSSEVAADKAIKEMDGQLLDGRNIRIHYGHVDGKQSTQPNSGVKWNTDYMITSHLSLGSGLVVKEGEVHSNSQKMLVG